MARRKIVLLVVEGETDENALGLFFSDFFRNCNKQLLVEVMHCDITTDIDNIPGKNIREKITNTVKRNANINKYKNEDYSQIIHIIDMDGAFIDNSHIIESEDSKLCLLKAEL